MSRKRCIMCQNNTYEPVGVKFYGWNFELTIPIEVHLCQRCHKVWKPQRKVIYVDTTGMTLDEIGDLLSKYRYK